MKIEKFDVSEECREKLRNAGFSKVDEIAKLLQQIVGNATLNISWGECFEDVVDELKRIGRLPEDYLES